MIRLDGSSVSSITRLASSQWTRACRNAFPFLFSTSTIWSSDPTKGATGVACCLGTCSLLLKERAIFSHTNITGRAIPIYWSDSVSLSTNHHFSESHRKFRNAGSSQGQGVMLSTHRLTERSHCGSAELRGWLTAAVLRDLDQAWTLKTAEQDEKHTVQRSKLEPKTTVTIIKYCVCHYVILSLIAALI